MGFSLRKKRLDTSKIHLWKFYLSRCSHKKIIFAVLLKMWKYAMENMANTDQTKK